MRLLLSLSLVMISIPLARAMDPPIKRVPIDITHEKGSFSGQLHFSATGTSKKAQVSWNGTIRNLSPRTISYVAFCVKLIGPDNGVISECAFLLIARYWKRGAALSFKGSRRIKISEEKSPVQVSEYQISVYEPASIRHFEARCPLVWTAGMQVFTDMKFRPTTIDTGSFTAVFAYEDLIKGTSDSKSTLKAYTNDHIDFFSREVSLRIDSASLRLREEQPGHCRAEVEMSLSGFGREFGADFETWRPVGSNFNFEKSILDAIEAQSKRAAELVTDQAISQVPTASPLPGESDVRAQLTITSEPGGAEIEIDGKFIGTTPTTLSAKEGSVTVLVKKNGFQPWQRQLKVRAGETRNVHAELLKQNVVINQP